MHFVYVCLCLVRVCVSLSLALFRVLFCGGIFVRLPLYDSDCLSVCVGGWGGGWVFTLVGVSVWFFLF
mgnify:CR=1 FL=1